jgi:enoyl-CoA hydratase/carnithine racemase
MLLTAQRYPAAEAKAMGLVNRVVPRAELEATVRQIAGTIAGNAPLSMHAAKALVDQVMKDAADRDMALCEELVRRCMQSEDFKEGRTAFMEKRRPDWKGR